MFSSFSSKYNYEVLYVYTTKIQFNGNLKGKMRRKIEKIQSIRSIHPIVLNQAWCNYKIGICLFRQQSRSFGDSYAVLTICGSYVELAYDSQLYLLLVFATRVLGNFLLTESD